MKNKLSRQTESNSILSCRNGFDFRVNIKFQYPNYSIDFRGKSTMNVIKVIPDMLQYVKIWLQEDSTVPKFTVS